MSYLRLAVAMLAVSVVGSAQGSRWTESRAKDWYAKQPWLVGANYMPANAINQLEMWQADSFDPRRIDLELGWAESIGMNTMRVFLHDAVWSADAAGFQKRIDEFLKIASRHKIRPMLVLFDSCWDPFPQSGKQRAPKAGVHNSGWVQGPGAKALLNPADEPRLEAYVKGVVAAFGKDKRVLAWDLWNEPDNTNASSYGSQEPANKVARVLELLPKTAAWARSANPSQPLTVGVWAGNWSEPDKMSPMTKVSLELSDIVSFHDYNDPVQFERRIDELRKYNRPLLCTEYMARGNKSTFAGSMPVAKKHSVAMMNWGLVAGKTQTFLPWDSWKQPYTDGREPTIWFHEVFRTDGAAYRQDEVDLIRTMTGKKAKAARAAA
ncbi:MAG: cellulase family glycosylhydrolase [Bryobacteraceae bacterium]|nr:cellulase family glycosylhydrolase [Bryobacteraceae bacterium]